MVSTTISHYKVIEKIGQGGMGEVYRTEDTNLSREMVIKLMPKFANGILSITLLLFLTAVGLAQGSWTSIGPNGGPSSSLAIDPTDPMKLYAGSGDGVFVIELPITASVSTVLVANFLNGNDAAFNSRVYLFNPSPSAGNVTVRVFTLPLIGGLAQELT